MVDWWTDDLILVLIGIGDSFLSAIEVGFCGDHVWTAFGTFVVLVDQFWRDLNWWW